MNDIKGLTDKQFQVVRSILKKHLQNFKNSKFFIFGSRAEGTHRINSDLDLLIQSDQPAELASLSFLKESFENSPLPFKVDIIEAQRMPDSILTNLNSLNKVEIKF